MSERASRGALGPLLSFLERHVGMAVLLVVFAGAVLFSPGYQRTSFPVFLTSENLGNLLQDISEIGILSIGMTFVILTAGIDLSVGSMLCFGSMMSAWILVHSGMGGGSTAGLVLLLSAGMGLFTGLCVALLRIPAFIVTLAMMGIARGIPRILAENRTIDIRDRSNFMAELASPVEPHLQWTIFLALVGITGLYLLRSTLGFALVRLRRHDEPVNDYIGSRRLFLGMCALTAIAAWFVAPTAAANSTLNLPKVYWFALLFVALLLAGGFVLRATRFGRYVYAVGGNAEAARVAGVPVMRIQISVYVISALLAGMTGIVHAARTFQGSPQDGLVANNELDAIAAVVVGGTSLFGGRGSMTKTLSGILIIGILRKIMSLRGLSSELQLVLLGVLILAAVKLPDLLIWLASRARQSRSSQEGPSR